MTRPASMRALRLVLAGVGCMGLTAASAQPLQLQPPQVSRPEATLSGTTAGKPPSAQGTRLPPVRPAGLGLPRLASAETAPAQPAPPAAPVAAAQATAAQAPRPATAPAATPAKARSGAPATQEEAIERLNAYLNSFTTLQGDFIQFANDGRRFEGRIYLQRPGKMRFEYDPPATTEVVADGTSVAVRDKRLATQDIYSIGQTPLKFLVRERMDLAREGTLAGASIDGNILSVRIEDRTTLGGTSKITLKFDLVANELRQWVVIDPQGYETAVSLYNLDTQRRPDPKKFVIDYQRKL